MLIPIWFDDSVLEEDAMAPPAACKSRATKSQVMKVRVYVLGLNRDRCSP